MLEVVFNDALCSNLMSARSEYGIFPRLIIADLWLLNLDVGRIDRPEDSSYRRIASFRLAVLPYSEVTDEELLLWSETDRGLEILRKAMAAGDSLRIWYSEEPRELCGLYYLCSLLTEYPGDVYAVRAPERIRYEDEQLCLLSNSTGNLNPACVVKTLETAVRLAPWEIALYAENWERLKQENSLLRAVISGRVVSVDADFYDRMILKHIPSESVMEKEALSTVVKANPWIQIGWCVLRIHEMIRLGQIAIAEDHPNPAERLIRRAD